MSVDTLSTLKNLDPALLTEVVRKQPQSPSFELLDWTVEPLSHAQILSSTGGLFKFSGQGQDSTGVKSWVIVLKILRQPPPEYEGGVRDVFYWKREFLAFESGLLGRLPSTVPVPQVYGTMEREDGAWLWMEYTADSTERRWSLENFQLAAYQFGRFGGAYLTGTPLPDYPWLSLPLFRSLLADNGNWANFMNPQSPQNAWEVPIVQKSFPEPTRSRILSIHADKQRFFDVLDQLPQVFCHNDVQRRNLIIRQTPTGNEVVALDWAWCGNGAVGVDAAGLVADTTFLGDSDVERIEVLEKAVFEAYLEGLYEAGWSGDSRLVRLGFVLSEALFHGGIIPGWSVFLLDEQDPVAMYGQPADQVLAGWQTLQEYLLERADEARHLIKELNLG